MDFVSALMHVSLLATAATQTMERRAQEDGSQHEVSSETGTLFPVFVTIGALCGVLGMMLTLWMAHRYNNRHINQPTHYISNLVQGGNSLQDRGKLTARSDMDDVVV